MEPRTIHAIQQFRQVLGLAPRDFSIPQTDPLQGSDAALLKDIAPVTAENAAA